MAYLADTNILIYHLNGIVTATQVLDRIGETGAAMSAISYMEIAVGLHRRRRTETAEQRFVVLVEQMRVLEFGLEEAIVAADIRHTLREQGWSVRTRGLDLLIAATAIAHDLTLITNNPSDYQDVPGLSMEIADLHV